MDRFLAAAARLASRRPVAVLVTLGLLTVLFGGLSTQQDVATDITEFAPEGELQDVLDRIEEAFGGQDQQLQVIVDTGPGGDVLGRDGLRAAERIGELVDEIDEVRELVATGGPGGGALSYALPVLPRLEPVGADLDTASDRVLEGVVAEAFDGPEGDQLVTLLSQDPRTGTARAGLVIVTFQRDADEDQITGASQALSDAIAEEDLGFVRADPFSFVLLTEDIEAGFEEDLPLLLGASFALIILILALMFRTFSDVALGVVGLVASLIWMTGLSVVLGPGVLGITGAFSQIAIAVPVLLVGLGVDYSVHLSSRYREERANGAAPEGAASSAITTVGAALLLATATTAIGFLSNVVSPLPPIADFGLFAAVGIASSFVILGLGVPAGRVLIDRRRESRGSDAAAAAPGSGRLIGAIADVPARAPVLALVVGLLVASVGGLLATQLGTEFDQEQFLPEGSESDRLLSLIDELFGGSVSERTEVLVTGGVREPEVLQAMLEVEQELADVDEVVTSDGRAEVRSVASLVRQLDQQVGATRQQLAAQFALLEDPQRALEVLPLPEVLTVEDLPPDAREEVSAADGGDELPTDDLDELEARLPPGVSATDAILAALPDADLTEAFREELVAQIEGEAPDLDDATLAALADLSTDEVTLGALEELGYPLDDLPDEVRDALELGAELRAAGWTGDALSDDADVPALLDVLEREAGEELEGVLRDDAALLSITTRGAEDDPFRVTEEIRDRLRPLTDQGVEVDVASQALLLEVTLEALTESQTEAIGVTLVAALLLLVLYYGITARRPALGVITMLPSLLSLPLILGTMVLIGLSFNALTVTVASISIGIGVPYGIHLTNRFLESRRRIAEAGDAIRDTVRHTGGALAGSAITTASGFGVLLLSDLEPIEQFGLVTAITIGFALVTALLVETSALVLWDGYHCKRGRVPDVDPGTARGEDRATEEVRT